MGRTSGADGIVEKRDQGDPPRSLRSRMPLGIQVSVGVVGLLCLAVASIIISGLVIMSVRGDEARPMITQCHMRPRWQPRH
jgi:hypothetical protein